MPRRLPRAATQVKAGAEEGSIDIESFKKMVAENPEDLQVIDVRDAGDFAKGNIKGAINIPVDNLEAKISFASRG